jgi:hypothetical protein
MIYDIFVKGNWVATRWQKYSTHLHTNSTENDTKQTIHRKTQTFWKIAGRAPSLREQVLGDKRGADRGLVGKPEGKRLL